MGRGRGEVGGRQEGEQRERHTQKEREGELI